MFLGNEAKKSEKMSLKISNMNTGKGPLHFGTRSSPTENITAPRSEDTLSPHPGIFGVQDMTLSSDLQI